MYVLIQAAIIYECKSKSTLLILSDLVDNKIFEQILGLPTDQAQQVYNLGASTHLYLKPLFIIFLEIWSLVDIIVYLADTILIPTTNSFLANYIDW